MNLGWRRWKKATLAAGMQVGSPGCSLCTDWQTESVTMETREDAKPWSCCEVIAARPKGGCVSSRAEPNNPTFCSTTGDEILGKRKWKVTVQTSQNELAGGPTLPAGMSQMVLELFSNVAVVCVRSSAVGHHAQLPAVCGVPGPLLSVLHPL